MPTKQDMSDDRIKESLEMLREDIDKRLTELDVKKEYSIKRFNACVQRICDGCPHNDVEKHILKQDIEFIDSKMFKTEEYIKKCNVCGQTLKKGRSFTFHKDFNPLYKGYVNFT